MKKHLMGVRFYIPGCTCLGIGLGLLFNQPGPGVLIGIGMGFILSAIASSLAKENKN